MFHTMLNFKCGERKIPVESKDGDKTKNKISKEKNKERNDNVIKYKRGSRYSTVSEKNNRIVEKSFHHFRDFAQRASGPVFGA